MVGYQKIIDVVEAAGECGLESQIVSDVQQCIKDNHSYTHWYFRHHVRMADECKNHCVTYSLSDGSPEFTSQCDHSHERLCFFCSQLQDIIDTVQGILESLFKKRRLDKRDFDLYQYDLQEAFKAILAFKHHIIRDVCQTHAFNSLRDQNNVNLVLIIIDWSMKIEQKWFREPTDKWYAKNYFSKHQTVFLRRKWVDGELVNDIQVHTAILTDSSKQNAATNAALFQTSLEIYCRANPGHFIGIVKSDNAV